MMRDDRDSQDVTPAKARPQEKVWMWIAIGVLVLYLVSLFAEWVHLNLAALLVIVLIVFLILVWLLRPTPPTSFKDCIEDCYDIQHAIDGSSLPLNPEDSWVIPLGPHEWLAVFWHSSDHGVPVTFTYNPEKRVVIGREVCEPDAIIRRIQENDFLSDMVKDRIKKKMQRDAEERAGYDTSEDDDRR